MKLERERQVQKLLTQWGWIAIRATKGPVDVLAMANEHEACHPLAPDHPVFIVHGLLFVQVKATSQSAYERFEPSERNVLFNLAVRAGAEPWLCWWPPNRRPTWIHGEQWPATRELLEAS